MKRLSILLFIIMMFAATVAISAQDDDAIVGTPDVPTEDSANTITAQSGVTVRQNVTPTAEELEIVQLTNDLRTSLGRGCLALDTTLVDAGRAHGYDMGINNYFSHTGLNGSTPLERARARGYSGTSYLGENIAAGNSTASATFQQWVNSSGHYNNMINGTYNVIGIGRAYVQGSTYRYYWVMMLAKVNNPPPCYTTVYEATNLNVSGNTTSTPVNMTFNWTHNTATDDDAYTPAEMYRLYVQRDGVLVYDNTFNQNVPCSGTSCSFAPPIAFYNGAYTWYVGSMANGLSTTWTQPQTFSVSVPFSGTVSRSAPGNNTANVDSNPILQWTANGNSSHYEIYIADANYAQVFSGTLAVGGDITCSGSNCSVYMALNLPNGLYYWYVRGYNGTYGSWHDPWAFRVGPVPPGTVTRDAPNNNASNVDTNPILQWSHTGNSSHYEIYIADASFASVFNSWLTVGGDITCSNGDCSVYMALNLPAGIYYWYVRGYNGAIGSWQTDAWTFRVGPEPPGIVTRNAPSNGATEIAANPTLQWQATDNSNYYELYLVNEQGVLYFNSWIIVGAGGITCNGGTCSITMNLSLPNGLYAWYVRGYNGVVGTWQTTPWTFRVGVSAPGTVSRSAPTNGASGVSGNPTFQWSATAESTFYEIYIVNEGGVVVQNRWLAVGTEVTCNASTCTFASTLNLPAGLYAWYVRGANAAGHGNWNAEPHVFTVN